MKLNKAFDDSRHIGIVCMDLVNNQGPTSKPEDSQNVKSREKHCEHGLVDCPNTNI